MTLRNIFLLVFFYLLIFTNCQKDNLSLVCDANICNIYRNDLFGKWEQDLDIKYIDNSNVVHDLITVYDFLDDDKFLVENNGFPFNYSLFSYPHISGSWSFDQTKKEILFFHTMEINDNTVDTLSTGRFKWKIYYYSKDSLFVNIYDDDETLISESTKLVRIE